VDLTKVSAGYYEIGTDIPAGTFTINFDRPADDYDMVSIDISASIFEILGRLLNLFSSIFLSLQSIKEIRVIFHIGGLMLF
jgi:hypothetical protein